MRELAILIPILRRPWRVRSVYESAIAATPEANILFICSPDDGSSIDAVHAVNVEPLVVDWPSGSRGDYARKINAGYRWTVEPLLFTGADDLHFHPRWYEAASALIDVPVETVEVMRSGILIGPGTAPRVGVVGTTDLCNERTMLGEHSTHSLVARWYADMGGCADQSGIIYCEAYWHEFCDDELVQTAMARHAYVHAYDAVVEHLHPNRNPSDHPRPNAVAIPDDDTYRLGRERSRLSRRVFISRRRLWRP